MTRIAVIDDYQSIAHRMADWDSLPDGTTVDFYPDHLSDHDALVERLKGYEIVQLMRERTPFQKKLLGALPKLELLSGTGRGHYSSVDTDYAAQKGIVLTGTAGSSGSVEELAWGLILALVKNLPQEDKTTREGPWQTLISPTLSGRNLGIIGLGRLGKRMAKIGLAFNMNIIAWSPWLTDERAAEQGAKRVSREEFFSTSDVITVQIPLTDESRGLITAEDFGRMKPEAYFINTSRGPIADEAALIKVLQEGKIAGAGLDVFDVEPLPAGHPFLTLPNTLLTPHIGFVSEENYKAFYGNALDNIKVYLSGEPINMINPEALEHRKG